MSSRSPVASRSLKDGFRDGIPIGLGYFAVAFSLGIAARRAGLGVFEGLLTSLLNNASAGEYAAFTLIAADAAYAEMALITLVTNARYLLMSVALSQRLSPKTGIVSRLLLGFGVTDEIFGISVSRDMPLDVRYPFGAMLIAVPCWAAGTALGIAAGQLLPTRIVSALGVALYGMFMAVFTPPARRDRTVRLVVLLGFALSAAMAYAPLVSAWSEGTRTILLTVLLAAGAAWLHPVDEPEPEVDTHDA